MAKFGRAAITWTSTEDANTQRVFLLDVPLADVVPGHSLATYYAESLDRTVNQTVTVGSGAYELQGKVRYASNPTGLMDVIKAGSQGKTLTYIPDTADPGIQEPVILIAPRSPAEVESDADRAFRGEASVTLRFRRTDQSASPGRSRGGDVLFEYHAGDSVAGATFTRSSGATYPGMASTSDFGHGTVSTAASNKLRIGWMSSASSDGPRTIPVLILEPPRTNLLAYSYQLKSWSSGGAALTTGQTDPAGGTKAVLVADDHAGVTEYVYRACSLASTYAVLSCFIKAGSNPQSADIRLNTAAGTARIEAYPITFSSGVPSVTWNVGTEAAPPERYRDGWWRISGCTTAATTAGTHNVYCYPAAGSAALQGNIYVYGFQVEQ